MWFPLILFSLQTGKTEDIQSVKYDKPKDFNFKIFFFFFLRIRKNDEKLMWHFQNTFVVSNEDPLLRGPSQTELPHADVMLLFWTHHWSGAREDCAIPQSQQLRGRQSCECFWAVPSSDHFLFFSPSDFLCLVSAKPTGLLLSFGADHFCQSLASIHPPITPRAKESRKARWTTEAVANGKTARSKEDEPIYQPSRVFSTKSGCSQKTWETWRCEQCWEGRKEVAKQEMKLDCRGLTAPWCVFVWADLPVRNVSLIFMERN